MQLWVDGSRNADQVDPTVRRLAAEMNRIAVNNRTFMIADMQEVEPLDPVAGHIPGALNRPFALNLGPDGRFKSPEELRSEFEALLAGRDPASVVHHCGSGVSAVPNVLGMEIAGLGRTALYAGSWSEWCNTPGLPCALS